MFVLAQDDAPPGTDALYVLLQPTGAQSSCCYANIFKQILKRHA